MACFIRYYRTHKKEPIKKKKLITVICTLNFIMHCKNKNKNLLPYTFEQLIFGINDFLCQNFHQLLKLPSFCLQSVNGETATVY